MSHHHHQDPHNHSSEHKHDYVKSNAEHFDKEAKNQEMVKVGTELAQLSAPYILKHYKFDKETTEVLDFASGWGTSSIMALQGPNSSDSGRPGLVSQQIIPYAKSILGVDVSQGMVDLYNETGEKEGFSGMKAVRAELKGEDGELDGQKFDVIIVSIAPSEMCAADSHSRCQQCNMAYHHFEDVGKMTKILAEFLKPGGKLIVSDFRASSEEVRKDFAHVIAHVHGMSEDIMRDAFAGAGLADIAVEDAFDYTMRERVLHIFFVVGSKA